MTVSRRQPMRTLLLAGGSLFVVIGLANLFTTREPDGPSYRPQEQPSSDGASGSQEASPSLPATASSGQTEPAQVAGVNPTSGPLREDSATEGSRGPSEGDVATEEVLPRTRVSLLPILSTDGLRLTGWVVGGVYDWSEPIRAELTLENAGFASISMDQSLFSVNSDALALEVLFEDGYKCERIREIGTVHGERPKVVLGQGEVRSLAVELSKWVKMTMIGKYSVRIGVDPNLNWGDGAETEWLGGSVELLVSKPSESRIKEMLETIPAEAPWSEYYYLDISRATDTADERLVERMEALSKRIDGELKERGDVPNRIVEEIRFFSEKREVWSIIRNERWDELRRYLERDSMQSFPRRQLQELITAAFSSKIPPK